MLRDLMKNVPLLVDFSTPRYLKLIYCVIYQWPMLYSPKNWEFQTICQKGTRDDLCPCIGLVPLPTSSLLLKSKGGSRSNRTIKPRKKRKLENYNPPLLKLSYIINGNNFYRSQKPEEII
ncbi:UNVERIFIED_CONTAM: hypothetical protein NCL1_22429 [Trichonephila clavipes]